MIDHSYIFIFALVAMGLLMALVSRKFPSRWRPPLKIFSLYLIALPFVALVGSKLAGEKDAAMVIVRRTPSLRGRLRLASI
jgi:cell division protein FtsW (lipid II flippase)